LSIDESFADARLELGKVLLRTGRTVEALEEFSLVLKYKPNNAIALNKMAAIEKLTFKR